MLEESQSAGKEHEANLKQEERQNGNGEDVQPVGSVMEHRVVWQVSQVKYSFTGYCHSVKHDKDDEHSSTLKEGGEGRC